LRLLAGSGDTVSAGVRESDHAGADADAQDQCRDGKEQGLHQQLLAPSVVGQDKSTAAPQSRIASQLFLFRGVNAQTLFRNRW
jgi:hypothetical protein